MSITTTTGYGRQWEQRVMSTITITLITIIMIMPTLMTTAILMTMTMTMTISRVICTMAKGKRDCRSRAWDSAS
ncbi:hypothetical protein D3C84_973760 [compost metagenome]